MTARFADCAYLHSAFGPGCPYCWQAVADPAPESLAGTSGQATAAEALEPGQGGPAVIGPHGISVLAESVPESSSAPIAPAA